MIHSHSSYFRRSAFAVIVAAGCALSPTFAQQTPTPAASPVTNSDEPVTELEKLTVTDVPLENQILPTVRPIGSVLGDDRSIIDTPRAVSSINKAWMEDRHVHDAMDFGQFSPGVYASAQYGIPATPQIRGDLAEIYVDGQRTNFSRNSVFPSFNGVEAMDIVKGPGSSVYGPQGEGPGGYVNLVTKSPYFDRQRTAVGFTLGYWTSGHSYWNPELSIDTGGPISDKLAYRVSYLSRYGDGYYINQKNRTQDIFAALTFLPSKDVRIDWWVQYYNSRFNEVTGANRVSQQFIDHGTYVGGSVVAGPDPYAGGAVSGTFALLDPDTAYTTKLASWRALLGPDDKALGKRFQTQMVTTADISENLSLVNRAYFEDRTSSKFETYGYDEYVPKDQSFQDRFEVHQTVKTGDLTNKFIGGLDYRYTRLISYQDFSNEPFFDYDLAAPGDLSGVFYPGYYAQEMTWGSGLAVPGAPGYSGQAFFNTGGNQDTSIHDLGVFLQDDISLGEHLSAVLGARVDRIKSDTASPELLQVYNNDTGESYDPGILLPKGTFYAADATVNDPSYFASLIYKASSTRSFYFTYNKVRAVTGSANFGGVHVGADFSGDDAYYHSQLVDSLKAESELYEVGYKESLLKNTLYGSIAVFQQTRQRPDSISAELERIKTRGFEFEAVYQPSKKLSLNANLTLQDAVEFASFLYEQTGNYLDGYPTSITVDGQPGTGVGSPNFGGFVPPDGRLKAAGVPRFMANVFATVDVGHGFGFGIGPQMQGKQDANQEGTLTIPFQMEWDGFVYYRQESWDMQISVKNLTNARLLDPIDVGFAGNDTIYVRPPISASFTLRKHF